MRKYYYSLDGPHQLIIRNSNGIYSAILYSTEELSECRINYTFFTFNLSIMFNRRWYREKSSHYKHHLKLALEELANA